MTYRVNAGRLPRSHWTHDPEVGGGRIVGEGCHFVDSCALPGRRAAASAAQAVAVGGGSEPREDDVAALVRFADGSVATIVYAAFGDPSLPKERSRCSARRVPACSTTSGELTLHRSGHETVREERRDKGHAAELEAFAEACRSGRQPWPVADMAAVMRATFAIRDARARRPDAACADPARLAVLPPEVGRDPEPDGAFAHGLAARGHRVTVVCEQPNHPQGVFRPGYGAAPADAIDGARHTRAPAVGGGVAAQDDRPAARLLRHLRGRRALRRRRPGPPPRRRRSPRRRRCPACSPPRRRAARVARRPFVLDVRDLWPAAAEALGELSDPRLVALFERAERWLYRHVGRASRARRARSAPTSTACAGRPSRATCPTARSTRWSSCPDASRRTAPSRSATSATSGIAQGLHDRARRRAGAGGRPASASARRRRPAGRASCGEARRGVSWLTVEFRSRRCRSTRLGALLARLPRAARAARATTRCSADFVPSKLYDAHGRRPAAGGRRRAGEPAALVRETRRRRRRRRPRTAPRWRRPSPRSRADPAPRGALGCAGRAAARAQTAAPGGRRAASEAVLRRGRPRSTA